MSADDRYQAAAEHFGEDDERLAWVDRHPCIFSALSIFALFLIFAPGLLWEHDLRGLVSLAVGCCGLWSFFALGVLSGEKKGRAS